MQVYLREYWEPGCELCVNSGEGRRASQAWERMWSALRAEPRPGAQAVHSSHGRASLGCTHHHTSGGHWTWLEKVLEVQASFYSSLNSIFRGSLQSVD